jgi:hypothetical protein
VTVTGRSALVNDVEMMFDGKQEAANGNLDMLEMCWS